MKNDKCDILLVEDSPGDARLVIEAFKEVEFDSNLALVQDGIEAMAYLRKEGEYVEAPTPSLILLDLNMPRKDGREVLAEIKADKDLKRIPVIILTTSQSDDDIIKMYNLHANCYVSKPADIDRFVDIVRAVKNFWFNAQLPPK